MARATVVTAAARAHLALQARRRPQTLRKGEMRCSRHIRQEPRAQRRRWRSGACRLERPRHARLTGRSKSRSSGHGGPQRARRRSQGDAAKHDPRARIQCVDHRAVADIDTDVTGPPKNIARPYLVERHLVERLALRARRSRNGHARMPPGRLRQPRTVEAPRTRATPTVRLAHLRQHEGRDRVRCRGRRGGPSRVSAPGRERRERQQPGRGEPPKNARQPAPHDAHGRKARHKSANCRPWGVLQRRREPIGSAALVRSLPRPGLSSPLGDRPPIFMTHPATPSGT